MIYNSINQKVDPVVYYISTGFFTAASFLFGGWSQSLTILLVLQCMDMCLGITKGYFGEGLRSRIMMEGIKRKFGVYFVIIISHFMDLLRLTPDGMEGIFKTVVISFYCVVEIISILENVALMGVPLPSFVVNRLKQVKDLLDAGKQNERK